MKISKFAQKYDIGISTVRYYVNMNLLLPKVQNRQFHFDERCIKDMDAIMMFKDFGFSINEIQSILRLTRLSNLTATDDVVDLIQMLEDKDAALHEDLKRAQLSLEELESYITKLKESCIPNGAVPIKHGVPIEMLPLICCPDCQTPLSLQGADIQNGQVIRAELSCACGYQAAIQNGILVTQGGAISELDSPDTDRKFYKDLPVSWVTLFQRAFNWMLTQYAAMDLDGKIVMENHINCYFFLFARLSDLNPNAYYIFTDKYPEIVAQFKRLIERQNLNLKILYIADSTFRYPLKRNCVDLYVDYHSLNEYAIFDKERDLFDIMTPYLRHGADILGTYFYFSPKSPSQRKLLRDYPCCAPVNFQFAHFQAAVKNCQFTREMTDEIGSVTEWGGQNRNFIYHVKDDPMYLYSYWYKAK